MLLLIVHKLSVTIQIMLEFTGRAKSEKQIKQSILYDAVLFLASVFLKEDIEQLIRFLKCEIGQEKREKRKIELIYYYYY